VNLGDFVTDTPARSSAVNAVGALPVGQRGAVIVGDDLVGGTPKPD
jgi:hypothetical protein